MGDYIYMQGTAKIRPMHRKVLQKFFNSRHDDADYELNWPKLVEDDPTIIVYSGYKVLKMAHGMGAESIPFGMSNPTGWPDSFDELPREEGDEYGIGECELDDEGNLTFKCSSRNRNRVMEAFISLVFYWAEDYKIEMDTREWAFDMFGGQDHVAVYTPGNEAGFDAIMEIVGNQLQEMERKAELWRLAPITVDEKEKLRALGLSESFLASLDGPSKNIVDVPSEPNLSTEWSKLVNKKLEQMGIPLELFTSSNPRPHESFADYVVRLGMTRVYKPDERVQSLNSPKLGQWNSTLEHIEAHKRFARGKKGVRQVRRKQRRAMK